MQHENEFRIQLNNHGAIDVDYYVNRAHALRSQAIGTGLQAFKTWLLGVVDRAWFPDKEHSHAPRRVVQSDWPWVDLILQSHPNRKVGQV